MKKNIILYFLFYIIGISSVYAQSNESFTTEINTDKGHWQPGTRSVVNEAPTLYLSETAVLIQSTCTLTNLEIIITDINGNIIDDSFVTVIGGVNYIYSIVGMKNGTYKIQLKQGKKYLYGYFNIESAK